MGQARRDEHPLLGIDAIDSDDVESHLRGIGDVLVVHRGHDSANTSAVIEIGAERWFVKWATDPRAVAELHSAIRFHGAVTHPAVVTLRSCFRTANGLALVHDWAGGEILNDPRVPGALPREHPTSAYSRFRRLPVEEIIAALDVIIDAHVAVAAAGFVAVDLYDGCVIYDFARRTVRLCDLDLYRPGPYVLESDRQYGSTLFMAPEEFRQGATIDERTTTFTLGRAAFVFLSRGQRGEEARSLWRAGHALHDVARTATRPDPESRYQSVADFTSAWQTASRAP